MVAVRLVVLVVIGSSIWVAADAASRNMPWVLWGIGSLLVWIVVFPLYLVERSKTRGTGPRLRNDFSIAAPHEQGRWEPDPVNPEQLERWREGKKWTRQVRARK